MKKRLLLETGRYIIKQLEEDSEETVRFNQLERFIPEATLKDFIEPVASLDNLLLIDIGSQFGEEFSLFVAEKNQESKVQVYNPQKIDHFPNYLFSRDTTEDTFHFRKNVPFSEQCISIGRLYRENNIDNVEFHLEAVDKDMLEDIARQNPDKQVVFFSHRTPTVPVEISSRIASVTGRYDNCSMVLSPYPIPRIKAYSNDAIIGIINENLQIAKDSPFDIQEDPVARLFTAMQLYYALKSAEVADADIYKESRHKIGHPFHHPTHYISTLKPKPLNTSSNI